VNADVDALDLRFVADIARALKRAIEEVDAFDLLEVDKVGATMLLAVAVATELDYDAITAFEVGFGAVASTFLDAD
jgi:hypothetical protein